MKSEFDLQNLGCEAYLRCGSSSSKAGLYFVEGWLLRRQTLQAGHFSKGLLKVDERESGELFGELF